MPIGRTCKNECTRTCVLLVRVKQRKVCRFTIGLRWLLSSLISGFQVLCLFLFSEKNRQFSNGFCNVVSLKTIPQTVNF